MGQLNKRHRLLLVWTLRTGVVVAAIAAWAIVTSGRREASVLPGQQVEGLTSVLSRSADGATSAIRFDDVTSAMAIDFRHFQADRSSVIAEDMGSGVAWGDYDGDGFVDLFVVNFGGSVRPGVPFPSESGLSRLYRNIEGRRFEDVTEAAGLRFAGFGMAAAWGDYDSDGDLDLYVTAYGDNALFENLGDGTFRNTTDAAGVQDGRFSAGCSFGDYDRDGDLDLYVCNYVDFVFRKADLAKEDPDWSGQPWTLNPSAYKPVANALFRNNGDGTFTEVAAEAGVTDPEGRGLAASWVDLDNDAWPDLYVANDVSKNGVFRNRGDGTFEDIGAGSLAADYRSAMGLALADLDNDLDLDLLVTHWIAQENAFFRNMSLDMGTARVSRGGLWFLDSADEVGLGQISLDAVGWATGFCDFDNDGLLDLWLVNGHTFEKEVEQGRRMLVPQRPFIFWNRDRDGFHDVAPLALPDSFQPFAGRGGAQADFDGDGRVDLAWLAHQGPLILLRNVSEGDGHWVRVDLRQERGNTFAIGARAFVTACGETRMAEVGCSPSYLSQNEHTLHFGLGDCEAVDSLRIVWPDGVTDTHEAVAIDRVHAYSRVASSSK